VIEVSAIPEPSTLVMLGAGLGLTIATIRRRSRRLAASRSDAQPDLI